MLIDWFTVIAQAINFLLLVWLLKRFLYQPILNALDARERRIAAELADADAKRAEAKMEREEFKRKNEEFDQQRAALLNKATGEAAAERQRLFDAARKDSDGLRAKRQDMLNSEYQSLHEEIARRTRAEVFAIARKTLMDLAGASLEERMVDVFVRRLRELDIGEKGRLASMFESSTIPVVVRSAFDLSPAQHALIEDAVKGTLAVEAQVRFEVVPDLVSGIELTLQGQKIAWSIADYLASLEKGVNELLKAQHQANSNTKP
ncbi:MAG: F0F1 ATP synthase subunit B [Gallionella sp.]|nr:F0F1 ATP synthase subunit B [Gallionella sp.]